MMLCRGGQVLNSSVLTHSAALLQAVPQANTQLFRNGLIETRNCGVEMRNRLGTLVVPVQFPSQMKRSKLTCTFEHKILIFFIPILSYLMNFINIFLLWKIHLIFAHTNIYCVGAGISTLISVSDRLDLYIFC